jgi:hypothetical protein
MKSLGISAHSGGFYILGNTIYTQGEDFLLIEVGCYVFGKTKLNNIKHKQISVSLSKCTTVWEWCYALSANTAGYFQNVSERFLAETIMNFDFKNVTDMIEMSEISNIDKNEIEIFDQLGWDSIIKSAVIYRASLINKTTKGIF